MNSPDEPTQVVKIFDSYSTSVKPGQGHHRLLAGDALSSKRPLATRLNFNETLEESPSDAKIPRLNKDPFDSVVGRKRFASEKNSASLAETINELKVRERDMKLKLAGALSRESTLESKLRQAELKQSTEKLELERQLEKTSRLYRDEKEKCNDLMRNLKRIKDNDSRSSLEERKSMRKSIDKEFELENKVRILREAKNKLQDQVDSLSKELDNRPEVDKISYRNQLQKLNSRVSELKHELSLKENEAKMLEGKCNAEKKLSTEVERLKEERSDHIIRIENLQAQLKANREAVMERKVMQDKLSHYAQLQEENIHLKRTNQLQQETQENIMLLKEQIQSLKNELERSERKAKDRDVFRAELEVARHEIKEWKELMSKFSSRDQALRQEDVSAEHGDIGVKSAQRILASYQAEDLEKVEALSDAKGSAENWKQKYTSASEEKDRMSVELARIQTEHVEQAKLIKKLQRKLLLVNKERESYRGILDSYEKELTISGSQLETEKMAALEKTLDEYKKMVDLLQSEEGHRIPVMPIPEHSSDNWKSKYDELTAKYEQLEMELERRAIKGDYNPSDTKVIHFKNNPLSVASDRQRQDVEKIVAENEALKARVNLLEEGHTRDLTLMVGHKLEEGTSSQEVLELRDKIKSAETKNQRIIEAFKKTSHEFRDFVYKLFGYRVDKKKDQNYKVTPMYAESSNDYLMYIMTEDGEVQLVESDYSAELGDLMDRYLGRHDSMPMFHAALTTKLFKKKQGIETDEDTQSEQEDDDEDEQEEEEEVDDDGAEENPDGEVVLIEDDDD